MPVTFPDDYNINIWGDIGHPTTEILLRRKTMKELNLDLDTLNVDSFEVSTNEFYQQENVISFGTHCSTRATCELSWCWCD